jgi:hypothetical protein
MARLGLIPRAGAVPKPERSTTSGPKPIRPLFDELLDEITLDFAADYVPLTGVSIPAGRCAWYGLKSWAVDSLGGDVVWCGHSIRLGKPANLFPFFDGAGGDYTGPVDVYGRGAVLVVGPNLPCKEGAWSAGPLMPGADLISGGTPETGTAGGRSTGMETARRFMFPDDPAGLNVSSITYRERSLPAGVLLTRGQRLDVALVVRRASVDGVTKSRGIAFQSLAGELSCIRTLGRSAVTR